MTQDGIDGFELTRDHVSEELTDMFRRCEAIRMLGGIALRDVYDGTPVPAGWLLDIPTQYYVSPKMLAALEGAKALH